MLYEVRYFVYAPNGRYIPAVTPSVGELEWEWGVTYPQDAEGRALRTLADDLESAESVAIEELNMLVDRDSEIRQQSDLAGDRWPRLGGGQS